MSKTILITGATDGIGLATARILVEQGHQLLLHGRNLDKLDAVTAELGESVRAYQADLSDINETCALTKQILNTESKIDVLINNAGVLKAPQTRLANGMDIRFMVNTLAPYLLTQRLLAIIPTNGRIINLSSAAQTTVELDALTGHKLLENDMDAYAQSKLALTIWSRWLAQQLPDGPVVVAVNPGSLLASKMVKEGFGVSGQDINIGANIIVEAALSSERFADASGKYYDNDAKCFSQPHDDALDEDTSAAVVAAISKVGKLLAEWQV